MDAKKAHALKCIVVTSRARNELVGTQDLRTSSNASVRKRVLDGVKENFAVSDGTMESTQGHCGNKRGGGGTIKGSVVTQGSVDGVLGPSNAPSTE